MTYMASCGSTTCDKFDVTKAEWFKISEDGRKSDGSGDWIQMDLCASPFFLSFSHPTNLFHSQRRRSQFPNPIHPRTRQLPPPPRDHRPAPRHLPRQGRVLPCLCPAPRWWLRYRYSLPERARHHPRSVQGYRPWYL